MKISYLFSLGVAIAYLILSPTLNANGEFTIQDILSKEAGQLRHLNVRTLKGEATKRLPAVRDLKYYSTLADRKLQTVPPPVATDAAGIPIVPLPAGLSGTTIAVIVLGVVVGLIILGGGIVFLFSMMFGGASSRAREAAVATESLQQSIALAQGGQASNPSLPPPPLLTRLV